MSVYKGPTLPMSSSVGHSLRGGWVVSRDSVRFYLVVVVGGFNRQCQIIVLHTGGKIDLQNKLQVTTWIFQVTLL